MSKVFLSAGHGGSDSGAVGNGLKEKDINLDILVACKSELERHGVTVVASRLKDENDPVGQEVREANASGADIAVSFHTNAGGGDGSETYYYNGSADSLRLAQICEKYVRAIGQNAHGQATKAGNDLYFVRKTKMPAVLCECAFIDSADVNIINTSDKRKAFGVAYAKAILEYLGIGYNTVTPVAPKPVAQPTTPTAPVSGSFRVKVTADALRIRSGAGTNYKIVGVIRDRGVYTIVQTSGNWGKLKSGAGWICLDYTKRV